MDRPGGGRGRRWWLHGWPPHLLRLGGGLSSSPRLGLVVDASTGAGERLGGGKSMEESATELRRQAAAADVAGVGRKGYRRRRGREDPAREAIGEDELATGLGAWRLGFSIAGWEFYTSGPDGLVARPVDKKRVLARAGARATRRRRQRTARIIEEPRSDG